MPVTAVSKIDFKKAKLSNSELLFLYENLLKPRQIEENTHLPGWRL